MEAFAVSPTGGTSGEETNRVFADLVLGMGYVILLWHSLSLQYNCLDKDGIPIMKFSKQVRKQKMYEISDDRSFLQLFPSQVEMIIQTRISVIKKRIPSNQRTQEKSEKMSIVEVHASSLENLVSQARGPSHKD